MSIDWEKGRWKTLREALSGDRGSLRKVKLWKNRSRSRSCPPRQDGYHCKAAFAGFRALKTCCGSDIKVRDASHAKKLKNSIRLRKKGGSRGWAPAFMGMVSKIAHTNRLSSPHLPQRGPSAPTVFCDVWLSSGSRRSPLLRRYRYRRAWALTFLSSLRVKAKRPQKRQSFCSFVLFFSYYFRIYWPSSWKETCRTKSNGSVSRWNFTASFGHASCRRTPSTSGLFYQDSSTTTSQRPPEIRSWHVHRICMSHIYVQTDFCV